MSSKRFFFNSMDILDESSETMLRREGERPTFLTILCILTWVGSGFAFFYGLIQLWSYAFISVAMKSIQANDVVSFGYLFWSAIAGIIGSILCVFGAIMMFKLKKTGFFIYLLGQIIPMTAGIYSALIMSSGMGLGGNTYFFIIIATMIFPIAFIIMYGVNLKYMNK